MAPDVSRTQLVKRSAVFFALSTITFFAYVLAGAWAHVFAPAQLLKVTGFHWYVGLVALTAAGLTGLVLGYLYAYFFPRNAAIWAFASALCVGAVYLAFAFGSGAGDVPGLSWIPILEVLLLAVTLPSVAYISEGARRARSI
jgi:hypothetical protein